MPRFQNINPLLKPKGFLDYFKWRLRSEKPLWPTFVPVIKKDHPPLRVEGSEIRVSYVGHATFLIQTASLNILTDPVWSHQIGPFSRLGPKRVTEPGVDFVSLPKIDLVLISHNHYDHMDLPTIKKLCARDCPLFVMPLKNEKYLKDIPNIRIKTLDWHAQFEFNDQCSIHLQPSQHWSRRTLWDTNKALWGTFLIQISGRCICFLGDTGYDPSIFKNIAEKFPNILLSLIPIGAFQPRWFMKVVHVNPAEAIQIHRDLNSKKSIACHFETFQLADDLFGEARLSIEKLKLENKDLDSFILPNIGQFFWY